jgi:glycosyltransferase involved in cell wall biosynthesis
VGRAADGRHGGGTPASKVRRRVSVGLPVYNGERFLPATLDSILKQDFDDFELIISDNGSTDATEALCRDYAASDPRIRYLRSPANRGAAHNYNTVAAAATGEYFTWAPHDDVYEPTYLSRCVDVLDTRPDVVVVQTRVKEIDDTGAVLFEWPAGFPGTEPRAATRVRRILQQPGQCLAVVGLIRRDILVRTGLIGPYSSSDIVLLAELAQYGRFYEVPEALYLHRDHDERSLRRYPRDRGRGEWFAPELRGKVLLPWMRLGWEFLRSTRRVPAPTGQRWLSRAQLVPWAWWWRGRLIREVPWAVREHWRRGSLAPVNRMLAGRGGRHDAPGGSDR